ncbi:hypothetical protein BDZ91DRAFT_709045 [Kalaharituber pfeilii]|nr:hypothetical protein BDZ91DRAFT_709045 [Kalaharituber pfeilii]
MAALQGNPSVISADINRSTRDVHDSINKIVMIRIALGFRDIRNFREGILSFFYIYKTFEEEWNLLLTNPPSHLPPRKKYILATLHSPYLMRTSALLRDLAFYFSLPSPEAALIKFSSPTTPQRKAYVAHVRAAIAKEPLVIIAYAHTMYLALFAGGKIIKSRMLATTGFFPKMEGMTREECQKAGTNLFEWEGVEKGREDEMVRGGFKRRLASVEGEVTEEERKAIVQEAREIFLQNGLLINELDRLTQERGTASSVMTWLGVILMALVSWLVYRVCVSWVLNLHLM